MPQNSDPQERRELDKIASQIPDVQRTLVDRHPQLTMPDRGAHQQQLAGSRVTLDIAGQLPPELAGLGIFAVGSRTPASAGFPRVLDVRMPKRTQTSSA